MTINLEGKSQYFKSTLLAIAKEPDVDPDRVRAFLQFADPETGSVKDIASIVKIAGVDGQISLRQIGNKVCICLNDASYGPRKIDKKKAIEIAKNEKLTPAIKLIWKHFHSGEYQEIVYTSLFNMYHITQEHLTREEPMYSRGFGHFTLQKEYINGRAEREDRDKNGDS